MKKLLLLICILAAGRCFAQVVSLNDKELTKLYQLITSDKNAGKLYASIKRTADAALNEAPNPVDTVVSEGHLATDPRKINTIRSLRDIDKIYALALCYRVENQRRYLDQLTGFLSAWASLNQPQGNPINDSKFEDLFFAYDLARAKMDANARTAIDQWLQQMADAEIRTYNPKTKKTSYNNWNSHRLKVIGLIAYVLNNTTYKNFIKTELPQQIDRNLLPDGSGMDFAERDALHYHIYTLEPLISLATVLQRGGDQNFYDYTSPSGASIRKSVAFLDPFATGEKTHPEFVNSQVAFDKKRAENHEAGYETGALFQPRTAIGVLTQAAYFDPAQIEIVRKLSGATETYPNWQSVINAARTK